MSLAELPDGQTVLVDANILLYAIQGASAEALAFLRRCSAGKLTAVVTSIVVGEFCHRGMVTEARSAGLAGSNPAQALARKPALFRKLSVYADDVRDLLDSPMIFEAVQRVDFVLALELQRAHALLTNDSLNLAVARRLAIRDIATADRNFDGVPDLAVHRPADLANRLTSRPKAG